LPIQFEVLEKESLDSSHIVISVELNDICRNQTHELVDCGATGYDCEDDELARNHNAQIYKFRTTRT